MWVVAGNASGCSGATDVTSARMRTADIRLQASIPRFAIWRCYAVPQPGQPHLLTRASVGERSGAMIDCPRGIPFRLKLIDEAGMPAEADVEYRPVMPNPYALVFFRGSGPMVLSRSTAP